MRRLRWIVVGLGVLGWLAPGRTVEADPVAQATKWFLQGQRYARAGKHGQARDAFEKAARIVPRHPHFYCQRARILNELGRAQARTGRPYVAMQSYRQAAGLCNKKSIRTLANRQYHSLFRRWMCVIEITSTPTDAWVFMDYKKVGRTPWKKVMKPGNHHFRVRLVDYQSTRFQVRLRAGQNITKHIRLKRGDDPIHRPERPAVAPPPDYQP